MTSNGDTAHFFDGWKERIESLIKEHPLQIQIAIKL